MKTKIVSTRIPAGQANGSYNISLPTGFGVPSGFLVYAMDNFEQPNNFDSTTDFPCISVGFGGSNTAGTGLTNGCVYLSCAEATTTAVLSGFGNTVSIFSTNNSGTVRRQWWMTGFGTDTIFGQYQGTGTQQTPLDVAFTVFAGSDFQCAIGQVAMPAVIGQIVNVSTTFQADAMFYSGMRPAQTTDGNINFGVAVRDAGSGSTNVLTQITSSWRNANGQTLSTCTARIDNTGTVNLATNASIRATYMGPAGVGFTQSTTSTANSVMFMAIKAGVGLSTNPTFAAGTFQSAVGTGNSYYAVGFKPQHIIGSFSHLPNLNNTQATSPNGADMISFFTANGYQEMNITGIGTFSSTTSSTTVTGVGTSFLNQLGAIDSIYTSDYRLVGVVSSITSNTALLLQSNAAITATGSSFVFEKPQQFSFSYGCEDASASGSLNQRGYISDNAAIGFSASTPTLQAVGYITNLDGQNGFNINYTTLVSGSGGRFGWYLAIKDDEFYNRRRGIIS
jgi:hypothetical protein